MNYNQNYNQNEIDHLKNMVYMINSDIYNIKQLLLNINTNVNTNTNTNVNTNVNTNTNDNFHRHNFRSNNVYNQHNIPEPHNSNFYNNRMNRDYDRTQSNMTNLIYDMLLDEPISRNSGIRNRYSRQNHLQTNLNDNIMSTSSTNVNNIQPSPNNI